MNIGQVKEALSILQKEGPIELLRASVKFVLRRVDPHNNYRFRYYTWKNYVQSYIRYDAPSRPYRRITVKPSEIDFRLRRNNGSMVIPKAKHGGIGQIKGGDWDTHRKEIEDTSDTRGAIVKGLRQRFREKKDWEETAYYKVGLSQYKDKSKKVGYDSVEEYVHDRTRSYEKLYDSISVEGYKPKHSKPSLRPGDSEQIESQLEVLIAINRDGEIYLFGGYHRFGIARALDLSIPAQVICRHKQWQELRDEIYKNGLPETHTHLRDHPDLQDILDGDM